MTSIILPTYIAKLPSSGKSVKFRPFTVKEEKSLLLALQEDDSEIIVEAIKNVIRVCTNNEVVPETTPYYDIEYLFLQIRGKSVGEIIELIGSCECSESAKTEFVISTNDIIIEPKPVGMAKIKIPDSVYSIELRHPSIDDFIKKFNNTDASSSEVVANCIVTVFNEDEVFNWSYKEKLEFVESMFPKQQKSIAAFLKEMPLIKIPTKYKCRACGKIHESEMTGFQNFFV